MADREKILKALEGENLKELGSDLTLRDITKEVSVNERGDVLIKMVLPRRGVEDIVKLKLFSALGDLEGLENIRVEFTYPQAPQGVPKPQIPTVGAGLPQRGRIRGVKRVILVGSGKGGVGKSTVAANLAFALKERSFKVGLLDADVYGPSIPTMLGLKNAAVTVNDEKMIVPVEKEGLRVLSIGLMLPSEDTPVVWRGPLVMKAVQQFLFEVDWGELDYLVVDLPPGTGDVQLTIAQNVLVDGAVVVSTPQDVALADVRKAISMFEQLSVPVLGIVENMAYFICPHCGKRSEIFGGSRRLKDYASRKGLEILAEIPIEPIISELSDGGKPLLSAAPESASAEAFRKLAERISQKVPVGG